ncbi:MAG: ComEC/Rec2 family competence protein [Sphingomicrobium sp.]
MPIWLVVGLIAGIAAWFALPDVRRWTAFAVVAAGLALGGLAVVPGRSGKAIGGFALATLVGLGLIWVRSIYVAAPRLERPVVTEVEGRVVQADRLATRAQLRLLLDTATPGLPPLVRVSIPLEKAPPGIEQGARVKVRARLAPPPGMALPGTYDFARDAWFKRIGAVGKAIGPLEVIAAAEPRGFTWARSALHRHIEARLPVSTRGIAIAFATGDQNAVSAEDAEAMRRSGLTHLLSVSGLHIAAVVAAVMLLTLRLLALSKTLALRLNLVLVAAGAAAVAGIGYTLLTGAQVPTVRSCVAAVLVLAGIALGRDALSMRLIAAGAVLVLVFRPEAAAGPSFQMSFAAVVAIVALHNSQWARRHLVRREEGGLARFVRALAGLVATGLAVEVALLPIALYYFHRTGLYGAAANIIAIPLTTFLIMPLEALALLLDAIGLGAPLWTFCSWTIAGLLALAHAVAGATGAVITLASIPAASFALMVVGGLWLCLWEGRVRLAGVPLVAAGAAAAFLSPTPDLLITGDGRNVVVIDRDGQPFVLRERSGDYVRSMLAEASGFDGELLALASAPFGRCSPDSCVAQFERGGRGWTVLAIRSRHFLDWRDMIATCATADIVVAERKLPDACAPRWLKLDRPALARSGGVSIHLDRKTPVVQTVSQQIADHPWAPPGLGEAPTSTKFSASVVSARRSRQADASVQRTESSR